MLHHWIVPSLLVSVFALSAAGAGISSACPCDDDDRKAGYCPGDDDDPKSLFCPGDDEDPKS